MRLRAKRKASFGPNLLKYFKPSAGDRQESSPAGSAGRSGGSSDGEPCLDDNGAGYGKPILSKSMQNQSSQCVRKLESW